MILTSQQCRAARGWFDWSQTDLATKSGVSRRAIAEFERELSVPHDRTLRDILRAFEEAGVELLFDGSRAVGLRVKP
jgi:transcriptional regulator with XRE-family HTH domain